MNLGLALTYHMLLWLQKRPRPVFMTRSRPYKKDDNARVEQKNWTHVRQCFGYERHDNPELVEPMNRLVKEEYGQLLNYFHASLKLESKERVAGKIFWQPAYVLDYTCAMRIRALRNRPNGTMVSW